MLKKTGKSQKEIELFSAATRDIMITYDGSIRDFEAEINADIEEEDKHANGEDDRHLETVEKSTNSENLRETVRCDGDEYLSGLYCLVKKLSQDIMDMKTDVNERFRDLCENNTLVPAGNRREVNNREEIQEPRYRNEMPRQQMVGQVPTFASAIKRR